MERSFHDPVIAEMARLAAATGAVMASQQDWAEFNGVSAGTKTDSVTNMNWKIVDDNTTAYTASNAVIPAGSNSMTKYQALRFFGGGWNNLSAFVYKLSTLNPLDSGAVASTSTRIYIAALVITTTSALTTPATTASGDPTTTANFTNGTGVSANFVSSTGVTGAATSTYGSGTTIVYAQALRTQLSTATAALPGDLSSAVTVTASWTES